MKIDINNALTVISLVFMLVGGIYRLAQIEASINAKISRVETDVLAAIDKLKDNFVERFYSTERNFDVHIQDYVNYKDACLLQNNNLNEKINHTWIKTKELCNEQKTEIKEIQGFLQKQQDFRIRE